MAWVIRSVSSLGFVRKTNRRYDWWWVSTIEQAWKWKTKRGAEAYRRNNIINGIIDGTNTILMVV